MTTTTAPARPTWRPMPSLIPRIQLMQDVYEAIADGESINAVTRDLGINRTSVHRWTRDPARWSPFVDDIAIARALDFEHAVIERLSVVEFDAFCAELNAVDWSPAPVNFIAGWTKDAEPIRVTIEDLDARDVRWYTLPEPWRTSIAERRALLRRRAEEQEAA